MNLENTGVGATGVEWVFKNYHDALPNIKKDDIVIFSITKFSRRWILKSQSGFLPDLNEELLIAETELFLDAVEAHMKRIGFKVIAFPCFKDCNTVCNIKRDSFIEVEGWLHEITKNEAIESETTTISIFLSKNVDNRFNHMCEPNHIILAEKIKKALEENTSINLLEGFKKDFLTIEMLKSGRQL